MAFRARLIAPDRPGVLQTKWVAEVEVTSCVTGPGRLLAGDRECWPRVYGVLRLLDLGWADARATVVWLAGGVVIHDALFAPILLAVTLLTVRLVPRERLRPPLLCFWSFSVPTTLLAIPKLGRFGARSTRPALVAGTTGSAGGSWSPW